MLMTIILIVQFVFSVIIGIYFFKALRQQTDNKQALDKESVKELNKLRRLQNIKLTTPLSEVTRPKNLDDIIGQQQGIRALRAALCSPNPQHVIIYGPPGIGKTAAARVVLEEAKKSIISPFTSEAKYVEIDATTLRFDDRGIADPLIGSVHDPIYQGAGAYGPSGIPQPKMGAVTKAHGGVLFIDEIGELHSIQMNKLLKVLEDRKVFLESAYYSSENNNIPAHIHEIFQKGLPADFRLVAATTRLPDEIPPAIRSRCVEVFFNPLSDDQIIEIASNAAKRSGSKISSQSLSFLSKYAHNGRDAVNIIQIANSIAVIENRTEIELADLEWIVEFGQYSPKIEKKVSEGEMIGCVNGLAVYGNSYGTVMDIEVSSTPTKKGMGKLMVTGIVEEEQFDGRGQKLTKKSSASASVYNMLTVLYKYYGIDYNDYDIHINFPCTAPVDGPSAGIAIVCAVYSSIKNIPIDSHIAMTGEISIKGIVKPVGGVVAKVNAAKKAGITKVLVPNENYQQLFNGMDIKVVGVSSIFEVFEQVFDIKTVNIKNQISVANDANVIIADGI